MPLKFLQLPKSAQFFRLNAGGASKASISNLFTWSSKKRVGNAIARVIKEDITTAEGAAHYSFLCFRLETEPPFLKGSALVDIRHAFLLLIEINGILAILRRYAQVSDDFLRRVSTPFGFKNLTGVIDPGSRFERLSLRAMGVSRNTIRQRSVQASDLASALPTVGLHRSIPSSFRTRGSSIHTISPGSSRVTQRDPREQLAELAAWASKIGKKIINGEKNGETTFLSNFCRPVPFAERPSELSPVSILFDSSQLEDLLTEDSLELQLSRTVDDKKLDVSPAIAAKLIDRLGQVMEISGDDVVYPIAHREPLKIGKIKAIKSGYRLKSSLLRHYEFTVEGKDDNLESLVNRLQLFTVVFSEPNFAYTDGRLFEDQRLIASTDGILDIIETNAALTHVSEEKDVTGAGFGPLGIFKVLEDSVPGGSVLFCDDLGDEWADYIEFASHEQPPRLTFYHCKHAKATSSASAFQEVIGQAVKNLSRLHVPTTDFEKKWTGTWAFPYVGSFPRLRKGDPKNVLSAIASGLKSSRTLREVVLVTSFASKESIRDHFTKFGAGKSLPHIVQLLWLLSGFVAACKEHSVIPRIICQP